MVDAVDYPNRTIGRKRLAPTDAVDREVVTVNMTESPLAWLARRGMLTVEQMAAGERLRADHYRSGLGVRVTMQWSPVSGSGAGSGAGAADQAIRAIEAKRRFDTAMAAVGKELSDILWRVVCEGEGISEAEKGLGWPARAAKLVLGMALDRLVEHYNNQNG